MPAKPPPKITTRFGTARNIALILRRMKTKHPATQLISANKVNDTPVDEVHHARALP
jgi:hypothetical protein